MNEDLVQTDCTIEGLSDTEKIAAIRYFLRPSNWWGNETPKHFARIQAILGDREGGAA